MLVLAGLGGGAWVERESLLRGAANLWVVTDSVTHADAIVVLGGGLESRPFVAADFYQKGLADKVLISQVVDGRAVAIGAVLGDTELTRRLLMKLGVPAAAIETFGKKNENTRDEATALREWVESHGARVVIIPTEFFFSRRVRWIFHKEFVGKDTRIEVLPIEASRYTRAEWWKKAEGIIDFQNEILKYIYYQFKY